MRTYDFNRGLMTALGAGIAGGLVWLASAYVGDESTGGYWATYGIIAGAGLVMALSQLLGGWTKFGMPRISAGTFLLGFIPVAIVVGWIACGLQPHGNTVRSHVLTWSGDVGIRDIVNDFKDYLGVLAFGLGLTFGFTFDTTGPRRREVIDERTRVAPMERAAADEPVSAERTEVASTTPVGPTARERDDELVGVRDGREVEIRHGGQPVAPRRDPEETP